MKVQNNQKETVKEEHSLQIILEASKKAVIQGSMGVLLVTYLLTKATFICVHKCYMNLVKQSCILLSVDLSCFCNFLQNFRDLLDDSRPLLNRLRDLIVDWVQEGFQDFFISLYNRFLLLSGKSSSVAPDLVFRDNIQGDKTYAGLVLVMAQLSVFIDQNAIPRITEASTNNFLNLF